MRASINVAIAGLLSFGVAALIGSAPTFAADWKPVGDTSSSVFIDAASIKLSWEPLQGLDALRTTWPCGP
jgi:hypothetical protein